MTCGGGYWPLTNNMSPEIRNLPKYKKRKKCLIVTVLALVAVTGAGCAGRTADGDATLLYWSANNPYEQELARLVVAEWNAAHPDLPVHHQPVPEGQSSEEVILAAIVGRTTPDIYSNVWPGDVEFYVRANALVRLDRFPDAERVLADRCVPSILEQSRSRDGGLYQVPWKTNPIMMIYNVKMFREVGLDRPPRTYSEYLQAAERIQRSSGSNGLRRWVGFRDIRLDWWQRFFDFYAFYLAASGGKTLVSRDSVLFENEAAVRVFRFFRTMYENQYFPMQKGNLSGDLFLKGRIASRFTGPWEIAHAEKFKPEGFEYDFAPLPVPDDHEGPAYTYGDPKNIVIFSTCKRPQAAWEFVKFLISRKNDLRLLKMATQLPLRKNLLSDSLFQTYFAANPKMIPFARQAQFVRGADQLPMMKEVFDIISSEYEAAVVYGVKSPEKAIHDAAARVRLISGLK